MKAWPIVVWLSGCSWMMTEPPRTLPEAGGFDCSDTLALPTLDGVMAAGLTVWEVAALSAHAGSFDADSVAIFGTITTAAVSFAISAVHGNRVSGRCRRAEALAASAPQTPADQEQHNDQTRMRAEQLTSLAAAAARAGDCDAVVRIAATVRWLDVGVHDTQYLRDAAIAECMFASAAPSAPRLIP